MIAGPKRVVFLTDVLGGGTGNHLLGMIRRWDASSLRPEIISGARLSARIPASAPIRRLPAPGWTDRYPVAQIRSVARIGRMLGEEPPDIVHTYFFWPIIYGRVLKMRGKIRTLVENREDQGFNWGAHEYALLRMTRNVPDRVICVSEAVRRVVVEREGLPEKRVVVIRNGIEPVGKPPGLRDETLRELGIGPGAPVVGMVANFNRAVKGVSHFLNAVPRILRSVPAARFLILGRGQEEQALRGHAGSLGVEHAVLFAGFRPDIERFYEIMDVSVLSSLSEGLSMTLLESMGFGIPVVATRVGGNPEVVIDGETGYLVPPKDPETLAGRIVELLLDPVLRRRMGERGFRRVEEEFQVKDAARRYAGLYAALLGEA